MSAADAGNSEESRGAPAAPGALLYPLVFLFPCSDFIQVGVVAFNAAPIMGDISASPEEYSLVATMYAVVAIAVISNHRWLLERLGWRGLARWSAVWFATGALICASSESLLSFAIGRLVMAIGCGNFFTAGRVIINLLPPSPKRFKGVKFFAAGVGWGGVLGPGLASLALSMGTWRDAFVALTGLAALLVLLGELALPAGRSSERSRIDPAGLPILLLGTLPLFASLQRSTFDFFSDPLPLAVGLGLAFPMLALFAYVTLGRDAPVLQLASMATRRVVVGLGIFACCYALLGANNTIMPALLAHGLDIPLEVETRLVALGALGSVGIWIIISRLLKYVQNPVGYYLLGLTLLGTFGWRLSQLSEDAHPYLDVVPALLCNGAFVIAMLSTTSLQTFRDLQQNETIFSHGNQVKNMLAQLGTASGTAIATLCVQWRSALHYSRLADAVALPAWIEMRGTLIGVFAPLSGASGAPSMAIATITDMVIQESTLMAVEDYGHAIVFVAAVGAMLVVSFAIWQRAKSRV